MQHLLVFSDQSQYNELFSSLSMKMTASKNEQCYDFAFYPSCLFRKLEECKGLFTYFQPSVFREPSIL